MPPRSPLPRRHGLDAAWVRTPDRGRGEWPTMGEWLRDRLPERVEVGAMLAEGRFVYDDLRPVGEGDRYTPHTFVWFHRELRDEPVVPGELHVVHQDERLVVVDKPAFLATIPRGKHVQQSVVVRLREELGLPELSPLHRLDRVTSGLVMLATERRWRGPHQLLFERRQVHKTYRALAPYRPDLQLPATVRNHLRKEPGVWQGEVVPGAPVNAETLVQLESRLEGDGRDGRDGGDGGDGELAIYRLTPRTGRTHQLRLHLLGLGIPIVDDPLYPEVGDMLVDDFRRPLQLLACELAFTDPVDGLPRSFETVRRLPLAPAAATGSVG